MPPRRALLLGAAASALSAGCGAGAGPKPPGGGAAGSPGVDALAQQYEGLMGEHGLAEWSRYAGEAHGGGDEAQAMAALRARERQAVASLAEASRREADRLEPREVELWLRAEQGLALLGDPRAVELGDRLEKIINDFKPQLDGKETTRAALRKLARSDDAAERRAAWKAWAPLQREAAPVARDLLRRRRALAGELKLPQGFYAALLSLRGLPPERLSALLSALDDQTRAAYADALVEARKAAGSARTTIYDSEWLTKKLGDLADERFPADQALPFARKLWGALGVDLDRPKVRVDVRDFAFGGQTISIRVPDDVRTVVSPAPGSRFYATMMHELGHAFAATRNREQRPVYKGYEWVPGLTEPGYDEGVAEVFGRLIDEEPVLAGFVPALSAEERALFLRTRARAELVGLRGRLSFVAFERAALDDPEADLDGLWKKLQRDLLGVEVPDDAEAMWATSPFLATYPVYTQSYTLAAMLSCQVRRALSARFGRAWVAPAAGALLAEQLVGDGARSRLDDKLRRLTGAPLGVEAYAAWLTGAG